MTLAVKHRPSDLNGIVGQDHVVLVLRALLTRAQAGELDLPTGLILTGPHGSGKTTTARIIAAMLNCQRPAVENATNLCVICRKIFANVYESVIEIDGATTGSVEAIRELVRVARLSHEGRYRVFVIDECHSISEAAWNALLKQLEEPPPGVLFILVTTDWRRIPATVQSRCLVFTYRAINEQTIGRRLAVIAKAERLAAEPQALLYLARRADGAMRDAIMLLEQLSIGGPITVERAEALWPNAIADFGDAFVRTAAQGDYPAGAKVIAAAFAQTSDTGPLYTAIAAFLDERALSARTRDAGRRISDLIAKLWDHQIVAQRARATDIQPLLGLWHLYTTLITAQPSVSLQDALYLQPEAKPTTLHSGKDALKRLA